MPLMYSRKSIGPRMELWETPVLTQYSWNSWKPNLKFHQTWVYEKDQNGKPCEKALDISSAPVPVASDQLKSLSTLSDTTIRRSSVDWENLEPC